MHNRWLGEYQKLYNFQTIIVIVIILHFFIFLYFNKYIPIKIYKYNNYIDLHKYKKNLLYNIIYIYKKKTIYTRITEEYEIYNPKLYLNTRLYTRVKFWRDRQVCFRSLLADLIAGSTNVPSCVLSIHAANLHQITPQLNSAKWLHRYRMAFNNEIPRYFDATLANIACIRIFVIFTRV